jgi:hypothetical protein
MIVADVATATFPRRASAHDRIPVIRGFPSFAEDVVHRVTRSGDTINCGMVKLRLDSPSPGMA